MHTLGLTQALNTVASYGNKALQANKLAEEKKATEAESKRRFDIRTEQRNRLIAIEEKNTENETNKIANETEKIRVTKNAINRGYRFIETQQAHEIEKEKAKLGLTENENKPKNIKTKKKIKSSKGGEL